MSFLKLDLKTEYRNQHIDVLNEFYLPLFEESKLYCRAVGFFSSSIFGNGIESNSSFVIPARIVPEQRCFIKD